MAKDENESLGAFGKLFNKNVPHILESIFLSLDYDSFMTCHDVCSTWKYLFMSDSYKEGTEKLLAEKLRREEMIHDSVRSGDIEEVNRLLSSGVDPNCRTFRTRIRGMIRRVLPLCHNSATSWGNASYYTPYES